MERERRPVYSAQHGIRFELILIRCSLSDRSALSYPRYATDIRQHVAIYKFIQQIFDYMQARDRICEMMVGRAGGGYIAGNSALGSLPTYHAGDRIIGVDAAVNGGIGPQRSAQSMLIKSTGR